MICTTTCQLEEVPEGDLIELRVDLLPEKDFEAIGRFRKKVKQKLILTASEEDAERLLALSPDYLDSGLKGNLISYHNYKEMPHDLDAVYRELKKTEAKLYKIAAYANSSLDTLRMLLWVKESGIKDLIAIPMGPKGTFGRILAPYLGSRFTFAYHETPTAGGQLPYEEMRQYTHFNNPSFYGLIGDPVDQSPSHITHNGVMKEANLNALYVKIPLSQEELPKALPLLKRLGFKGLSATMPLKEALVPLMDELTEEAEAIGAVNTLSFTEGKILGDNTDGRGALGVQDLRGKKVLILGAGGAAKALIHRAISLGADVRIRNRTPERGIQLAARFGLSLENALDYDLLINCTPNPLPVPEEAILPGKCVMETKTRPKETALLEAARKKNCTIIYGEEMFIGQAVLQFKRWFPKSDASFKDLIIKFMYT